MNDRAPYVYRRVYGDFGKLQMRGVAPTEVTPISQGRDTGSRGGEPTACFDIWLATFHIIEMLYDTPFPETAQTDHTPEKADRNAEIIARYEAGEAGASIAQAFAISEQHVNQIIRGQRS